MQIKKAAVLGAGVMGAQIAAHLANAGIPCLLLDIAPKELTPEEAAKGLTLDSKDVRDRIVAAVLGVVNGIAVEFARYGVRANAILPGWVETEMTAHLQQHEKFNQSAIGRVPLRRAKWKTTPTPPRPFPPPGVTP